MNIRSIYVLGAILLVLSSCIKENTVQEENLTRITLQASIAEPGSRVFVTPDNLVPSWSEDDLIAVFDNSCHPFSISECNGSSAIFEGEISSDFTGTLYAAYPYAAASSISGSNISMVLPSEQTVADGSAVDQAAMLSVAASSDGSSLYFRNVGGLVRFEIKADDVVSVKLEGNNDEKFAGTLNVQTSTAVAADGGTSSSVTVTSQSGAPLAPGIYYAVVAPVTFTKGITLTITNASGLTASKISGNQAEIQRSCCLNLGDVTTGLTWGEDTYEDGIIESEDSDPDNDDIVSNTTFDYVVRVIYSNTGPAVVKNASKLDVQIDGNGVTITNATKKNIIYELSGSTSNGFFKLYSEKKQAIVLNGVSITNPSGAAINNQSKKRTFIEVRGANSLRDGTSYTATPEGEDEKGVMFSEGQIVFSGSGSLNITAEGKAGISSDDYVSFMSSPTVTVTASKGNGIRGKDHVLIANSNIGVTCSTAGGRGITSGGIVTITGGATSITMTGGVIYDSDDDDYKGSDAIKADNCFRMTGGSLTINNTGAGGKGIRAGDYDYDPVNHTVEDSYITGGTISISTVGKESNDVSGKAVKIGWITRYGDSDNGTITGNAGNLIISGGNISLNSKYGECLEVKGTLTIDGGELYAVSGREDPINTQGPVNINGGYIFVFSHDNDAIDSNNNLTVSGGYLMAITRRGMPEHALDAGEEFGYNVRIGSEANIVLLGDTQSTTIREQNVYRFQNPTAGWNALYGQDGFLWAFKLPENCTYEQVMVASPSVTAGYKDVEVDGSTLCNGVWALSGISGGTQVTLKKTGPNNGY